MYTRTATVRSVWWLWRWRIRWTGLQGLYVFTKSLRYICWKTSNVVIFKAVMVDYMDTCCASGIAMWKSFRLIFQMCFLLLLILFVANDQASKHTLKRIPSCTGTVSCKYVASKLSLSFIPASNGDICGKRMNPCGEDAVCNHTNTNAICHCKPGFQRNLRSRKCEGTVRLSSLILLTFRKMIHCFIWGGFTLSM